MQRRVDLYYDGGWHDVLDDVLARDGITIRRGRDDEASQADPSVCELTLRDDELSGTWNPRHPLSPLYGKVNQNSLLRVGMVDEETRLLCPAHYSGPAATAAYAAPLAITGDLDLRVDMRLPGWWVGSDVTVAGRWVPGSVSWALQIAAGGFPRLVWSPNNGATVPGAQANAQLPNGGGRLTIRVTLDVDNGGGGSTVTFYTGNGISSAWTQLGDPIYGPAPTSIYGGTARLEVGDVAAFQAASPMRGIIYGVQLRAGLVGTVVAHADMSALAPGTTAWTDSAGRAWTVHAPGEITNGWVRFTGEVPSWSLDWHISGNDVWAPLEAAGITRRLGQGRDPLQSALRRRVPRGINGVPPAAYWPLEEEQGAIRAYSPIPGCQPLTVKGVDFGGDGTLYGSAALPTMDEGASLVGPVPSFTSGAWTVEWVQHVPDPPEGGTGPQIMRWQSSGTVRTWTITLDAAAIRITGIGSGNTEILSQALTPLDLFGGWTRVSVRVVQNGGNVDWRLQWIDIGGNTWQWNATFGGLIGAPTHVFATPGIEGMSLGHLSVIPAAGSSPYSQADYGFQAERAATRVARLCGEEDVPVELHGLSALQTTLGAQRPLGLLDLLHEAADADHGILTETREQSALLYRGRDTLIGQGPAVILPYGELVAIPPTADDLETPNDVTASRPYGSSARVVVEQGPKSIQLPPNGIGHYTDSIERNVGSDDLLIDAAGWHAHLGTWHEARYPTVQIKMHALDAETQRQLCMLDIGDRLLITDPPPWLEPGDIDLMVQGYEEEIAPEPGEWLLTLTCTPARVWDTAIIEDAHLGRLDTDGSALGQALDETATQMFVSSWPNVPWVSGNRVLNANYSFEADAAGWAAAGGTMARINSLFKDGSWSLQLTPDGVSEFPALQYQFVPVEGGAQHRASAWMRCSTSRTLGLNVNWFSGVGAYVSTSSIAVPVTGGQWTYAAGIVTAPEGAAFAQLSPTNPGFPAVGDRMTVDDVRLATVGGNLDTVINPNPSFDDFLNNWNGVGGTLVRVDNISRVGAYSARLTPDGGSQYPAIQSRYVPVAPGQVLRASAWLRCAVGRQLDFNVNFHAIAGGYISTSTIPVTVAANTWTKATGLVTVPAGAAFAVLAPTVSNFPPPSNIMWADDVRLAIPQDTEQFPFDIVVGGEQMTVTAIADQVSPQLFTVVRSVNGIVKSHAEGTSVALHIPAYASL